MNQQVIDVQEKATPVLREYGATYAGVFGSVARGEATSTSDVDMVVALGQPMGLVRYIQFVDALKCALAREVDVVAPNMHPILKRRITRDIVGIYGNA
jgi:predicted nucleotidyltransferase